MKKIFKIYLTFLYLFFVQFIVAQSYKYPIFSDTSVNNYSWDKRIAIDSKIKLPDSIHCFSGVGLFMFQIKSSGKVEFIDFKGHLPNIAIKNIKKVITETCCWQPAVQEGHVVDSKVFYLPVSIILPYEDSKCNNTELLTNMHEEYNVAEIMASLFTKKYTKTEDNYGLPFVETPDGYVFGMLTFEFFHPKE